MIKLFATDLDGTLINTEKNITQKNIDAIKKLKDDETIITVCTGRTLSEVHNIPQFKDISPFVDYVIYENGASCIDNKKNEMMFARAIKYADIKKIYSMLSDFDMMFEVYTNGKPHCNIDRLETKSYQDFITPDFYPLVEDTRIGVNNVIEFSKDKKIQMLLISFLTHEHSVEAYEIVKELDNYITFAGKKGIEVHDSDVDKGKGIGILAQKLKISKENITAIGDSYNDIPMREVAGTLIAMQNATSHLKNIADFITISNDDSGVAYAIEKYFI